MGDNDTALQPDASSGSPEPHNEFVVRRPHPRLRPFVADYTAYRMSGLAPGTHQGLPSQYLTFIVAFDDPVDVAPGGDESRRDTYWGMLAGLHSDPALIRHSGSQHGVQLAVTPRGATALFGVPASALASTVAHLGQVVPAFADELVDRLSAATSWRARWAVLDEVFLRALDLDRVLSPELERAWSVLVSTAGQTRVEDLADEAGWSRRHFSQQFRQTYGLTPKMMARVLRFERAQKMLRLPTAPSLASIAAACGYSDQAHMTREWNEFAGSSPTSWLTAEDLPAPPATEDPTFLQA